MEAELLTDDIQVKIAFLNAKMTKLRALQNQLNNCKTTLTPTYSNYYFDHVQGNKYDEMYEEEQEAIKTTSQKLLSKKTDVNELVEEHIKQLDFEIRELRSILQAQQARDN